MFAEIRQYVKQHQLGRVYPDNVNYVLDGDADDIRLMRIPNVSFVRQERVVPSQGYCYYAPDLAVEIASPSELERPER